MLKKKKKKMTVILLSILISIAIIAVVTLVVTNTPQVAGSDFRNVFGASWRDYAEPCDIVDYAKQMGYDYVMYRDGIEKCEDAKDLYFYISSPDSFGEFIDITKYYSQAKKEYYNRVLVWKSTQSFPYNLATGWWNTPSSFRGIYDFQQQSIIDERIEYQINRIKGLENKENNFLFGGFAWDVPHLHGDMWTGRQKSNAYPTATGRQTSLTAWTGSNSGLLHEGITHEYDDYIESVAEFRKQLFAEAKKINQDLKIWYEPYHPYSGYVEVYQNRADKQLLKADFMTQEDGDSNNPVDDLEFLDERLFASGLIERGSTGSSTPDTFTHSENLRIAGNAGINGAWFTWFGRYGGTGDMPNYNSIKDVPKRLKLIRTMVGWDNLNNVKLSKRSYTNKVYKSTLSYADSHIIYSKHPKREEFFVVYVDNLRTDIILPVGTYVEDIYRTDDLFRKTISVKGEFTINGNIIKINQNPSQDSGYIIGVR